jgi:hypothetical protein
MTTITIQASTISSDDTPLLNAIDTASNGDIILITGSGQFALTEPLTIDKNIIIEGQLSPSGSPNVTIEADPSFPNTSNSLITIATGAVVSLNNLNVSGAGQSDDAPDGADGDDGDDGEDGADGSGDTGGVGTAGSSGVGATPNADNAIGAIANNGTLTLNNDFVHGAAVGGAGGAGGRGGYGGAGGTGGSGTSDGDVAGTGGNGGVGGLGGDGGDGSNGGNATGAILNAADATLNLSDTVIADSSALGGKGGGGGDGGYGGNGGVGGAGGGVLNDQPSGAGTGGSGGDGNNGGNGGDGGGGGSAVGGISNSGVINVNGAALLYFNNATAGSAGTGGNYGGVGGGGEGGEGGYNGEGFGTTGEEGADGGFPGNNGTPGAAGSATANVQGNSNGLTIENGSVGGAYYTFAQSQPQGPIIQLTASETSVTFTYDVNMVGDTADGGSVEWTVVSGVNGPAQNDFFGHVSSGTVSFPDTTGAISGFDGVERTLSFTLDVSPTVQDENFSVVLSNPGGAGTSSSPHGVLGASVSLDETINGVEPPPDVTSVTATPTSGGILGLGQTAKIDLDMSEAVVVSGTPTLKLSDGGTAFYNSAASNPTSGLLEFDYTVSSGQHTTDLTITGITVPSGGSIKNLSGQGANVALTAAEENLHLTVDGIPPTVTSVTVLTSSGGEISSGGSATITLKLSEGVTVSGIPVLDLNDGGSATFTSAPTSSTLVFTYVAGAEVAADLKITGVNETSGTITDSAGNELATGLTSALKIAVNVDSWAHGSSGNFNTSGDWTLGAPPTSGEEASISVAGAYTVSSTANATVAALNLTDPTATLLVASNTTFTATSGTATDADAGKITVEDGAVLALGGTFVNNGTITLSGIPTATTVLDVAGTQLTLAGTGKVILTDAQGVAIVAGGSNGTVLTNAGNVIAGAGSIGASDKLLLINDGIIDADTSSTLTIRTGSNTIVNSATLEATASGGLVIDSNVSNTKTIEALGSSADVVLNGVTVSNGGTALVLASGGGAHVDLDGATVSGGELRTSGSKAVIDTVSATSNAIDGASILSGSLVEVTSGGLLTLSGATTVSSGATISVTSGSTAIVNGPTTIGTGGTIGVASGGTAIVDGAVTNSGTIALSSGTLAVDSDGATLQGGGKVVLDGGSIVADSVSATLENLNDTISGTGIIGGNALLTLENLGTIEAPTSATLTINTGSNTVTNAGTAAATGTKAHLIIDSDVSNSGLIEAAGASATVLLNFVTVDNVGGSIVASGAGAQIVLDNAAISGGALKTSASGAIATVSGSVDNTISGGIVSSGSLVEVASDSQLTISGGTISAGAVVETMSGSAGSGGVLIASGVTNSGTLFASGANSLVQITGVVSGGGVAEVGNGTLDIQDAGRETVTFQAGGTGGLKLDDAIAFSGTVSGFGQNTHQFIDLSQIASNSSVSLSYTPNSSHPTSSGVLTVSSGGVAVASIDLIGHYVTSNFHISSGAGGSVEIIDPPVVVAGGWQSANIALLGNYIAGSFVAAAGGQGGTVLSTMSQGDQPLLVHPHTA